MGKQSLLLFQSKNSPKLSLSPHSKRPGLDRSNMLQSDVYLVSSKPREHCCVRQAMTDRRHFYRKSTIVQHICLHSYLWAWSHMTTARICIYFIAVDIAHQILEHMGLYKVWNVVIYKVQRKPTQQQPWLPVRQDLHYFMCLAGNWNCLKKGRELSLQIIDF